MTDKSGFDYGPFSPEDWAWLLAEARKQDPEAVLFAKWQDNYHLGVFNARTRRGLIVSRNVIALRAAPSNVGMFFEHPLIVSEFARAATERRIYPDHAELKQESDEAWLHRTVFEMTGIEPDEFCYSPALNALFFGVASRTLPALRLGAKSFRSHDVSVLRQELRHGGWPLKPTIGIDPASGDSVTGAVTRRGDEVVSVSIDEPSPNPLGEICLSTHCDECGVELDKAVEAQRCYKCETRRRQAGINGHISCRVCHARTRNDIGHTADGKCAYCYRRTHFCEDEFTERTAARGSNVAARARLAALESRQRPRPTATSVELAKPHPWNCDDSLVGTP